MLPVSLIRRVAFSAGHRYWNPGLDRAANVEQFGRFASPYNHGHNYVLDVTAVGIVEESTGMVVNIKDIDAALQERVVDELDGKSLNDEIRPFDVETPTLENLLLFLARIIQPLPAGVHLSRLRLEESPELWADLEYMPKDHMDGFRLTLTRTYEFAASHRLHSPGISDEENLAMYGKCNNPAGHGHNYVLEVTVTGKPDPKTGMMVDLEAMDRVVEEQVVERFDHKHLNVDVPEFAGKSPTSEVIALEIWRLLDDKLPAQLSKVRLNETARSAFEIERQ